MMDGISLVAYFQRVVQVSHELIISKAWMHSFVAMYCSWPIIMAFSTKVRVQQAPVAIWAELGRRRILMHIEVTECILLLRDATPKYVVRLSVCLSVCDVQVP